VRTPSRATIVVPCYNEEARFDLPAFDAYLASHPGIGFILVNDGSDDGTMARLRQAEARWPDRVSVIDQQPNQGKGEAVRVGILRAMDGGAAYAGYFDADLATPLDAIDEFVSTLDENQNIDIVMGARVALLGRHIDRNPARHYAGRVFATAASLVLALPVYDTQCGAKLLRVSATTRDIFALPFGSRWIFDVEMLARYLAGAGRKDGIYELPLRRWTDVGESRVKPMDFVRAGGEMAAIYRTYRIRNDRNALLALATAPFLRYASAGGVGTMLHYATLAVAVTLFHARPERATVMGALVGAAVNYLVNYHFTFASKSRHRATLPRFLAVAVLSAQVNGLGMWLLTRKFGIYYLAAQVCCTVVVLLVGFALNKLWTFRSASSHAAP
jgi:dolichyl-phosphate beta-glucosyltransferase